MKVNKQKTGNRIICINRQFGSGGHEVGKLLAEKLGIPFYDEEIIDDNEIDIIQNNKDNEKDDLER